MNSKRTARGIDTLCFILYYRKIGFKKTAWYWHGNKYVDQYNQTEDPNITLHTYGHLNFDNGTRNNTVKNSIFNK